MSKQICFIRSGSVRATMGLFHALHEHFSKEFEHLFFVNVSKIFTSRFIGDPDDDNASNALPANFTYVVPKSLSDFKEFLSTHELVVICYFSETWPDWWIHYYLRKYSIPLVYIHTHSTIVKFLYNKAHKEMIFVRLWNEIKVLYSRFLRYMGIRYFLHDVDTLFISHRNKAERIKNSRKGRYRKSEIVTTNSKFYDSILSNNYHVSNDYVVFLDSMLPYHKDQLRFGFQLVERDLYYTNLNRILGIIGATLGKEVVVCLHPKYDEKNLHRDFEGQKTVKYRTDEFVAKAELVLFHESSAINIAIVYGKKIIQLTGSKFNDFVQNNCLCYQKCLPLVSLDIYQCSKHQVKDAIKAAEFNRKQYDSFLSNYIIASGHEGVSSCEQIADHLNHKYGIPTKR